MKTSSSSSCSWRLMPGGLPGNNFRESWLRLDCLCEMMRLDGSVRSDTPFMHEHQREQHSEITSEAAAALLASPSQRLLSCATGDCHVSLPEEVSLGLHLEAEPRRRRFEHSRVSRVLRNRQLDASLLGYIKGSPQTRTFSPSLIAAERRPLTGNQD